MVKQLPIERMKHGMLVWDLKSAQTVLDAYLIYYKYDNNSPEIKEFYERICKYIGYWFIDKYSNETFLDLHRYNYDQLKFVLHYLLTSKSEELIEMMGYNWIILTGKRLSVKPI